MDWTKATDTELLTIIAHDPMASALDVTAAAEEWRRRHPHSIQKTIVQYKIKEAYPK